MASTHTHPSGAGRAGQRAAAVARPGRFGWTSRSAAQTRTGVGGVRRCATHRPASPMERGPGAANARARERVTLRHGCAVGLAAPRRVAVGRRGSWRVSRALSAAPPSPRSVRRAWGHGGGCTVYVTSGVGMARVVYARRAGGSGSGDDGDAGRRRVALPAGVDPPPMRARRPATRIDLVRTTTTVQSCRARG
ncbi:hypothetical protein BS78_07G173800 [Paspalum vaginatum]|nr:hypothetical protein BS78_07G173800 [Paspalum vaginatum]